MTTCRYLADGVYQAFARFSEAVEEFMTAYAESSARWLDTAWLEVARDLVSAERRALDEISEPSRPRVQTPAVRLRELSGLDANRLASIFGVSRASYQHWVAGSIPKGARREHLLEVLPLIEEAAELLGGRNATSTWMLSPILPGGPRPIDLLSKREYDAFRGSLLRAPIEHRMMTRPAPFGRRRQMTATEVDEALQRLSGRGWDNDDEANADES